MQKIDKDLNRDLQDSDDNSPIGLNNENSP